MHQTPLQTAIERLQSVLSKATDPSDIALLTEKLIEAVKAAEATEERLMTLEEGAYFLGLRPDSLRKHCSAQRIPCVKVGSLTRFLRESLLRWAKEQERPMNSVYRKRR
ncbi:MAG: helix-turn-helix domain-containing protein [Candidatus Xenobiia bacterium LiM19]